MQRLRSDIAAVAGLVALLTMMSACDLTALNKNPNVPTEPILPFMFSNAEVDFASQYWGQAALGRFGNLYAQYWALTQYTEESRYRGIDALAAGMWVDYYLILSDLQVIIQTVRAQPELASKYGDPQAQIAMAMTLQAYTYQLMTDIWGPLPFNEALAGLKDRAPVYNSQEQIYTALIDSISTAINGFPRGGQALADADLIFGGDLTKWKAFATSLKMRLAIRMAEAKPEMAEKAFREAFAGTTLDEIDANALIPFASSEPYANPIYYNQVIQGREDWAVTTTLLGLMNQWEDPRRRAYAQQSSDGDYTGFPYGLPSGMAASLWANASEDLSLPSERVAFMATAPAILLTASEVLFMKAEAAQRRWIPGDPAAFYEQAIRASMAYWGVTDEAAIDAYLAKVPYDPAHWKQVLGVQKWIAFYMQGVQGWSVFRRLDFDGVFVVPPGNPGMSLFGDNFPVRLPYPNTAASLNGESWSEAVERYLGGDDTQGVPLWWDDQRAGEPQE